MQNPVLTRLALALATSSLAACVAGGGEPPPLTPLAEDMGAPQLALFEHVLTGHFAGIGANPPTTCAALSPVPLTPAQEEALIVRLARLAPAGRCVGREGAVVDSITGEPAQLVQIYQFSCASETLCSGWVARPGAPATRYSLRYQDGRWHFDGDPRIIAE